MHVTSSVTRILAIWHRSYCQRPSLSICATSCSASGPPCARMSPGQPARLCIVVAISRVAYKVMNLTDLVVRDPRDPRAKTRRLTWMSMTNTVDANVLSGASRASGAAVPGQSHISSGTTVLGRAALSARCAGGGWGQTRRTRTYAWSHGASSPGRTSASAGGC